MIPRDCPHCRVPLETADYEGFRVWNCPQCRGHLLDLSRFEAIKRLPRKTLAELETEAREGFAGDHPEPVRCPRCHLRMAKRPLAMPGFDLHADVCVACALAWLDGGELALAQLGHQATPGFRDAAEMQRRHAALAADPERKAAFDEAVARLPRDAHPVSDDLQGFLAEALLDFLRHGKRNWPRL